MKSLAKVIKLIISVLYGDFCSEFNREQVQYRELNSPAAVAQNF